MKNENMELEELIDSIGQCILEDEVGTSVLNPYGIERIRFSCALLEKMAKCADMKVSTALHEPFNSMGSICVEGNVLEFGDCKWLGRAIEFANNVEIFPVNDGKIRMVLTFHGLTAPIKIK